MFELMINWNGAAINFPLKEFIVESKYVKWWLMWRNCTLQHEIFCCHLKPFDCIEIVYVSVKAFGVHDEQHSWRDPDSFVHSIRVNGTQMHIVWLKKLQSIKSHTRIMNISMGLMTCWSLNFQISTLLEVIYF